MTTKKILLMVGGVVVALGFLVVCFVGAIAGIVLYQVSQSEAAARSREFLRKNEKLQADIGPVKDFGSIVTGRISFGENTGVAILHFKVIGERKTVNANVNLVLTNRIWVITEAVYVNSSGQTVSLLNPYDTKIPIPRLVA
jgi:uncharacterized membrane protein YccF (DUF307 family)